MRPEPELTPITPQPHSSTVHVHPSNNNSLCNTQNHDCRWWPYANASDFGSNAALILILLLCALISVLAINAAIRCFMKTRISGANNNNNTSTDRNNNSDDIMKQTTPPPLVVATVVVYSLGMRFGGGGGECTDCAICLSEFVEGDGVRVLGKCKHAFHVHCIEPWLSCHFSCPTCRRNCLAPSSPETGPAVAPLELVSVNQQQQEERDQTTRA